MRGYLGSMATASISPPLAGWEDYTGDLPREAWPFNGSSLTTAGSSSPGNGYRIPRPASRRESTYGRRA
jgi:hypothetical protein